MDLSRPSADTPEGTHRAPQADRVAPTAATAATRRPGPWIATLAVVAVALGRGLSDALAGARSGIETWIHLSSLVSALATQLVAILAATETALLLASTLWRRQLGHVYRLVVLPAGAAVVTLIALSVRQRLDAELLVVTSLAAAAIATSATAQAVGRPSTRAAGLVIGASTAAGLFYLVARHGALAGGGLGYSDVPARWLRPAATAGFAMDVGATAAALVWLARGTRPRVTLLCLCGAGMVAFLLAWAAAHGAEPDAGLGAILASRFVTALTPHPAPLVADAVHGSFEVFALLAAAVMIWAPGRPQPLRVGLGLVLLARASLDIPLCALLFSLGSLTIPLFSGPEAAGMGQPVEKLREEKSTHGP